ncbi:MAG: ion transporter [Planctomycetota bacterium]
MKNETLETSPEPELLVKELLATQEARARREPGASHRARRAHGELAEWFGTHCGQTRAGIQVILDHFEARSGALAAVEGAGRPAAAATLLVLEDDLHTIERLVAHLEGREETPGCVRAASELAWLSSQLRDLEREHRSDPAADLPRAQARLRDLERDLLLRRARHLIEEPLDNLPASEIAVRLDRCITYRALLQEFGLCRESEETMARLELRRAGSRLAIEERAVAATENVRRALMRRVADDMADRACDRLASLEDLGLGASMQVCHDLREDLLWLDRLAGRDPGDSRNRKRSRRLQRLARRLATELEERQVQQRLEAWLGRRSVTALERTVLGLIVAVLGLLLVEGLFTLSPPWPHLLVAVDLVICTVFLAEYFLKVAASSTPWRYAARHFLLDLIPSIPYGVLLHLSGFDVTRSARAVRLARLPRFARYLRLMRPFVRALRLVGFMLRGLDRLVRRHAALLNVNIVLFEGEDLSGERALAPRITAAARRCRGRLSALLPRLEIPDARAIIEERLKEAARILEEDPFESPAQECGRNEETARHEISFHSLVSLLTALDPPLVRSTLGPETAARLHTVLGYLDLPLLRSLPLVRHFARGARQLDPYEAAARCGRVIGWFLNRLLETGRVFADLWGIVTAPRLLDRVGTAMAMAARRPAMRLLIFGTLFLLLQLIVEGIGLTGLEGLTSWITRVVGTPLLILGSVCLVIFLMGRWLQQIAGEATETFRQIAEAQYINLLGEGKREHQEEDVAIIYQRVLASSDDPLEIRAGVRELSDHVLAGERAHHEPVPGSLTLRALGRWGDIEGIVLLYRDYLDGATLHTSDRKTSEQLIGNLALQNIRDERLGIGRRERKRLAKLNLSQSRLLSFAPHMWFHYITGSLSEQTAKLLLDYNRHAIPLADQTRYSGEELERFRTWVRADVEETIYRPGREAASIIELAEDTQKLRTTQFTALHFLTRSPYRDALVREEFGEEVASRLQRDRRNMIRHVFGHYPYQQIPRARRTFNPYEFYWRHCGGARVVLVPAKVALVVALGLLRLLRLTTRTVRSLLDPTRATGRIRPSVTTIEIAHRKIARMRRPIYLECLDLRARFDPEYLGCQLPGLRAPPRSIACLEEDLAFVKARLAEYRRYETVRHRTQAHLDRLTRLLNGRGLDAAAIERRHRESSWREDGEALPDAMLLPPEDSLRALAIAYVIDYKGLRTALHLGEDIRTLFEEAVRRRGRLPGKAPDTEGPGLSPEESRFSRGRSQFFSPILHGGLEVVWREICPELTRTEQTYCRSYVRANLAHIRKRLELLGKAGSVVAAREAAESLLWDVIDRPRLWCRQLITLRTLQTLAVLDVRNDRDAVETLAELNA